jgi:hypothetical protein
VTAADRRRLSVLRNIHNVFFERLYESSSVSRSVKAETTWLAARGLIEPYVDGNGEHRYRITAAGSGQLDAWEAAA